MYMSYAQMSKAIAVVPIDLRLTAQASVSLHDCPIRLILQGGSLNYAETLGNDEYVSISFFVCRWVNSNKEMTD